MGRNDHYFVKKTERIAKAELHNKLMEKTYKDEISESCLNTKIYSDNCPSIRGNYRPEILIENADSVTSILNNKNLGKICVLNFASFKNPGGMFLKGSSAQEESLCHESFLYNVISRKPEFYEWNKQHLNKGLYTNRALLSPNIVFEREDEKCICDVLTCASPNKSLIRYGSFSDEENYKILEKRIEFVCDILNENKYDAVILGAFGCGVFAQNPKEVAELFDKYLTDFVGPTKAIFAIPGGENLKAFEEYFESKIKEQNKNRG